MINNDFSRKYTNLLEKNFSNFININVNKIINYALNNPQIASVIAIGSLAKREMRNYSNINLVFLIHGNADMLYTSIKNALIQTLTFSIQNADKMFFYLDYVSNVETRVIEVEIVLRTNVSDLKNFLIGSNLVIEDIQTMILVDKDGLLPQELNNLLQENEEFRNDLPKIITKLSSDFIQNFAKACFNLRKTDLYQYYVNLSNCFTTIAKLDAIRHDNIENLIQPVYALARLDLRKEFPFYRLNLPNISITDKDLRLEYLFQFNHIMKKLNSKYNVGYFEEEVEKFLKKLDKEIYFWNLRDISYLDSEHLKAGVFYRSSSLSRYSDRKELKNFFSTQNIHTIIDLRSEEEINNSSYSDIEDINYVNIPIGEKENMDINKLKYVTPESFNIFYEMFLRYHQDEIKRIFETLAYNNGAFVLHCHAGRDRTGLVVALLLELLGERSSIISESLISEDYLNTGDSTDRNVFSIYTKTLKEFGGAKNYLQSIIGVNNETINTIIEKFCK